MSEHPTPDAADDLLRLWTLGQRGAVALKVRDIDSERPLLRVEPGKGAKDRNVIISPALLSALRNYWRAVGPRHWLFPGREYSVPLGIESAQRAFTGAKRRTGIDKIGGIHALRHAYATHQLASGMPVHQLQRLLGHRDIRSTLRYVHWVADYREGKNGVDLIAGMEVRDG